MRSFKTHLIIASAVLALSACGSGSSKSSTSTSTQVVSDSPVATFSAPTFVLPRSTQSANAEKPMASPTSAPSESAPPPTVVPTSTPTVTTTPSAPNSSTSTSTPSTSAVANLTSSSLGLTNQPIVPVSASGGNVTPAHSALSWYTSSVKPGQVGTMVVIGYRSDTLSKVGSVKTGDKITVGSTTYTVKSQHTDTMSALPSDTGLWGATTSKQLGIVVVDGLKAEVILAVAS